MVSGQSITIIALRLLLALVFGYSGILKLLDVNFFADSLNAYRILPVVAVPFFSYYISIFELVLATAFLWNRYTRPVACLTILMVIVFQFALSSLLVRGIEIDCACFGRLASSPSMALVRNFILLALLFLLLKWHDRSATWSKQQDTEEKIQL